MKTALIFGASGGIGQAFTRYCQKNYDSIIVCSRDIEHLQICDKKFAANAICYEVDPTKEEQLAQLSEQLSQGNYKLSLIVNACGLLHQEGGPFPEKKIEDFDAEQFKKIIEANTIVTPLIAKHFLPLLEKGAKGLGTTGIFASLSARVGSISDNYLGGWYSYRASKAALNQIIKTLAIESSRRFKHCAILALHPGTTDTKLSKPFQENVPKGKLFSPDYSVSKMMKIIKNADLEDNGKFFAWDGQVIEW
ncbi:SDR family NAD(P)-dependent oxidoreductase [Kangiella sediminilitoris]|nr:SDR family NAD(P)-dependent oxidoreductase [Kangiella sediminilitoris]